jgi:hypothetical protein
MWAGPWAAVHGDPARIGVEQSGTAFFRGSAFSSGKNRIPLSGNML